MSSDKLSKSQYSTQQVEELGVESGSASYQAASCQRMAGGLQAATRLIPKGSRARSGNALEEPTRGLPPVNEGTRREE